MNISCGRFDERIKLPTKPGRVLVLYQTEAVFNLCIEYCLYNSRQTIKRAT